MSSPKHYSTFRVASTNEQLTKGLDIPIKDYVNGCKLAKISGRIDSTASTDSYYIHVIETETPLDNLSNGAIPGRLVIAPKKIQHTANTDSTIDIDFSPDFVKVKYCVVVVSTTEFTLTKVISDILSADVLYH